MQVMPEDTSTHFELFSGLFGPRNRLKMYIFDSHYQPLRLKSSFQNGPKPRIQATASKLICHWAKTQQKFQSNTDMRKLE